MSKSLKETTYFGENWMYFKIAMSVASSELVDCNTMSDGIDLEVSVYMLGCATLFNFSISGQIFWKSFFKCGNAWQGL